jgi:RNA polymerase sigma-70 factor (ECF subfamily)
VPEKYKSCASNRQITASIFLQNPKRRILAMSEDRCFVQRCLNGEKDAFGALVDKYKNAVYGLAYREVRNFEDAQDIGQEVFIAAYKNLHTLKHPHRFGSWIYTITVNQCRMWLRKRARNPLTIASADGRESEFALQNRAIQQNRERKISDRLHDAIDELPESSRLVVILYYINGLTCKEIAAFTGTKLNTVKSKLNRARDALRMHLTEVPDQATVQHSVSSRFTSKVLGVIENLSPTPQPTVNPIGQVAWAPVAAVLILGLVVLGIKSATPLDSRASGAKIDEKPHIRSFSSDGLTLSIINSKGEESKPLLTPPPVAEPALYAAADVDSEGGQPSGGFQYRLTPGELWTYTVNRETRDDGQLSKTRIEGTHTLLVTKATPENGLTHIAQMAVEELMIRGKRPDHPDATVGMTFVNRDGNIRDAPHLAYKDIKRYLKEVDLQKEPPVISGEFYFGGGYDLLGDGNMNPYFIAFPSKSLKRGDTWHGHSEKYLSIRPEQGFEKEKYLSIRPEKYTVLGFEKVNGYDCVILERETKISTDKWVKVWMAFDTQSGMLVKLKGESYKRLYSQERNASSKHFIESVDYTTVELSEQEQLTPKALAIEQQALNQIQWAMLELELAWREPPEDVSGGASKTLWDARKALRERLKQVKAKYPNSRLMPGIVGLINDVNEEEESKKIRFKDFLLKQ